MDLNQNELQILLEQAEILIRAGKLDLAIVKYSKVLSLDSQNLEAAFGLSQCLLHTGKLEDAKDVLQKALANYPQNSLLWSNLGNYYLLIKDYKKALDSFKQALTLDPNRAENSYNVYLTNLNLSPNKIENYLEFLHTAIKLEPTNTTFRYNLAYYYQSKKDYKKAQEIYLAVLKDDPNNANVLNNYGICCVVLSENQKAKELFALALRANPNLKQARNNFIMILDKENKLFWWSRFLSALVIAVPFLPIYLLLQLIKFKADSSRKQALRILIIFLILIATLVLLPKIFLSLKLHLVIIFYTICVSIFIFVCLPWMKKLDNIQNKLIDDEILKLKYL